MALTSSEQAPRLPARASLLRLWDNLKARLGDAEDLLMQRLAGTVFLIRAGSAVLAYRLAGPAGALDGQLRFRHLRLRLDLGAADRPAARPRALHAAQRFIPEYRERGALELLRGFLSGSRWLAVRPCDAVAVLCAGGIWLHRALARRLSRASAVPRLRQLPAYALANVQDGIARSYDWIGLAPDADLRRASVRAHRC